MEKHGKSLAAVIDRPLEVEPPTTDTVSELLEVPHAARDIGNRILLWNSRRVLFRAILWGLLAGLIFAFLLPTRYTSTMSLMPPEQQSGMGTAMLATLMGKGAGSASGSGGGGGGLAALAGDVLGIKNSSDLFIGVLRSRTVQENIVRKFDLRRVYGDRLWEDACKDLEKNTEIASDRKSGIISISVRDSKPQRAASVAEAYGAELNRVVNQLNTSAAHRERVFLEERLKEISQDLEQAEKEFSQFSSKNAAIDIKEQGKAMVEATAMLQGQLIAAESQLQALRQIYNENSARVKATQAEVTELRAQLEKLGGFDAQMTPNAESQQASLYPSMKKLPLLGVTYADLYRRTKVDEVVFEALTQQYEMAKVQEAKDTPSVKVLDSPSVPERKSFPPRLLIILLCALLAAVGAGMAVIAEARWQATDPQDPDKQLVREVFLTARARIPWLARNGSQPHGLGHRFWSIKRNFPVNRPEHKH